MKAKEIPTADLIPYARNSRTHSDQQVTQIAGSIREFGFLNPVIIDENKTIIAGHGRVLAAAKMKLEKVPCVQFSHLTDAQKRAYVIADNRLAMNAGWDEELLANELSDLFADDFELDLLGFDADELEKMLDLDTSENEVAEDEVPEPPADPVTQSGDLWLLGEHRLLCGDSTSADDVARLMNGAKADLCFTSPPYGQQRDYTEEGKEKCKDWDALMRGVFGNLPMTDNGQVLVNLGLIHRKNEWVPYWEGWIQWMRSHGWRQFGLYVWDQGAGLPGDWAGRFAPSFELVFHFNKKSIKPNKWIETKAESQAAKGKGGTVGFRKEGGSVQCYSPDSIGQPFKIPDSVIRVNRNSQDGKLHPATFPVALPSFAMESWDGVAYEPFCGSGTTVIAAEQLNRKCYGMEISPQYCDVIIQRWEKLTGDKARKAD